jgi:hypothetical protein
MTELRKIEVVYTIDWSKMSFVPDWLSEEDKAKEQRHGFFYGGEDNFPLKEAAKYLERYIEKNEIYKFDYKRRTRQLK